MHRRNKHTPTTTQECNRRQKGPYFVRVRKRLDFRHRAVIHVLGNERARAHHSCFHTSGVCRPAVVHLCRVRPELMVARADPHDHIMSRCYGCDGGRIVWSCAASLLALVFNRCPDLRNSINIQKQNGSPAESTNRSKFSCKCAQVDARFPSRLQFEMTNEGTSISNPN